MLLDELVVTYQSPVFSKRIITIVGGYGSGKSEVAVNLARHLVSENSPALKPVSIVDLDIVNPYFRSREATEQLESLGIRAIHPRGGQRYADLPIILPEIKSGIRNNEGTMVLDVGGDDVGARVLSSIADAFSPDAYDLLFVVNANRPFTATVDGCVKTMKEIEASSRLIFTGLISNTHLMDDTSADTVLTGLELAREVSHVRDLPIVFLSAVPKVLEKIDKDKIDVPVLPLVRSLLKPWERSG